MRNNAPMNTHVDSPLLTAALEEEIRTRADGAEQARRMPDDLARTLAAAGLFRMLVPEQMGGLELHPNTFVSTLRQIAASDGAVGWVVMIGATTGVLSASLPDAWAKLIYADNPGVITSGVTAPLGRGTPSAGGLTVRGRWPFGSGCQVSQWICGGTVVYDGDTPRLNDRGEPQPLLVFFAADDVRIHDTWHTSGLRGTGSHDIEVTDLAVPEGRWAVLGQGSRVDRPLYRFPTLGLLALGVSAVALGIADRALEEIQTLAGSKVPTGSTRSLANRPSLQKDVAKATARLESAAALTRETIDVAWDAAHTHARIDRETKARLRLAAANNAWAAAEAVDRLYHAAGGSAIYERSALQRCFRDVHVATQHLMVAQPIFEVAGKVLLGMDPKTLL